VCAAPRTLPLAARQLRRLLDAEKVMFDTDLDGHVSRLVSHDGRPAAPADGWRYAVDITAEQDVVAPRGHPTPQTIQFNLVLEGLVLGGAPREAVRMGALVAVTLVLAFWHLVPRARARLYSEAAKCTVWH
jgi:hypothetical protein